MSDDMTQLISLVNTGSISINAARVAIGLTPLPGGDEVVTPEFAKAPNLARAIQSLRDLGFPWSTINLMLAAALR